MWWTASFEPRWVVSLVPRESSTVWETVLDLIDADLVARDPVNLISEARSDAQVPLPWLPYLAEERSVDEFDSSWPEERQRAVTKASRSVHQIKGTRPSLDRAMAPMGYQTKVVEWFEVQPRRQANTFRLSITIDQDREWYGHDMKTMIRAANKAKNAHTKLEAIETRRNMPPAVVYVGGLTKRAEIIRIGQLPDIDTIRISGIVHIGAVVRLVQTMRIQQRA